MSNMRNGERLGFLLALLSVEQLTELGLVDPERPGHRPSNRKLLLMIDKKARTFYSSHRRVLGSIELQKKIPAEHFDYFAALIHKNTNSP